MTDYNVDNLTAAEFNGEFDSTDMSVGSNTGNPILLASLTKTDAEWGNLPAWQSAANNSHGISQAALTQLKSLYAGKIVDLEGLYVTSTDV
jgi:hypothetical protein